MSKFKKFFGAAAVAAAVAGVIAYFMKKDRPVEAEFETPDDDEDFEQDLKDLFDDCKEEPAVHVVTNETEKPSEEAAAEEPEEEKAPTAETAAPVSTEEEADSSQEEKETPELEKPEETAQEETIAVEAPASQEE